MPNTNVFRGSDATLTLAVDTGPEGDAANEIIELYQLSPVGRAFEGHVKQHGAEGAPGRARTGGPPTRS